MSSSTSTTPAPAPAAAAAAEASQQPQRTTKPKKDDANNSGSNSNSNNRLCYFFFSKDDLVWIHPKRGYPLWPAEVQSMDTNTHTVTCKLICPPDDALAAQNLTAHASKLFYFDKYVSQQQMDADIERKLQRDRFDVSAFEATFRRAVQLASRLASCPMTAPAVREGMQFTVAPIGVVHSPFRSHCDAPRQPSTGATQLEGQGGVIRVAPELQPGLQDLKGFERVWVIFHFSFSEPAADDDNDDDDDDGKKGEGEKRGAAAAAASAAATNITANTANNNTVFLSRPDRHTPSTAFNTQLVPPRDTKKRGVFATRTPHRPNFIGLSCVRLLDVRGCDVHITDHDLLHGTPVLDIKPYLPFCDSHPDARAGWVDALNRSGAAKGDHRPVGSTDYTVTRARGLKLEDVSNNNNNNNKDGKKDD